MKIGIQTCGTDGDIRPYLTLANGLSAAGHEVTLVYTSPQNKDYSAIAETLNIKLIKAYKKLNPEKDKIFMDIVKKKNTVKQIRLVLTHFVEPATEEMYQASLKLCSENDMVISHSNIHTLFTAAEKYNCPRAAAHLFPRLIESKYIPPIGAPNLGKGLNPLLWKIGDYYTKKKLFPSANKIRKKEGFPPIKSFLREVCISKDLTLIAASPSLCASQPDWEDNIQICGFFDVPSFSEDWEMPEDLRTFINAGDPPLFLTFGSYTPFDVEDTTRFLIETARLSRLRAIIQSDWENVSFIPDDPNIHRIGMAPHRNIFPHCSVIVHHGGAGTTQSTLQSGCPSVVVEHAFDQNYWGQQLFRVGAAGKPLHKRTTTPRKLAAYIHLTLNSPLLKKNAQKMREKMKTEDGVKKAVELIEKHFQ